MKEVVVAMVVWPMRKAMQSTIVEMDDRQRQWLENSFEDWKEDVMLLESHVLPDDWMLVTYWSPSLQQQQRLLPLPYDCWHFETSDDDVELDCLTMKAYWSSLDVLDDELLSLMPHVLIKIERILMMIWNSS